ncbi:MAG: imidazoleglycerol-phosphate dehydratase [Rhodobacteraceae bacterium]|nr:MAG: imidazoleglycerol-phosphate dehydratase [Paracoccaceae bacterium]
MKKVLMIVALLLPSFAYAAPLTGVFQTEPGDEGGVLHVGMAPCADDAALTCGTILRAYKADGTANTEYEHLGKPIVWAMSDGGNGKWGGGKIWAPDRDKTYASKMSMNGNMLQVKGCVAFICRTQNWIPVP